MHKSGKLFFRKLGRGHSQPPYHAAVEQLMNQDFNASESSKILKRLGVNLNHLQVEMSKLMREQA